VTQNSESFAIPKPKDNPRDIPLAIARTGPIDTADDPSLQWLYTLVNGPVAWLQPDDPDTLPLPEILLSQHGLPSAEAQWRFLQRLLDAEEFDNAFTLDAARFSRLGRNSVDGSDQYDYDGDGGDTIRFGDGTFGEIPTDGAVFDVTYRVGGGAIGNVAADSITQVSTNAQKEVIAVTNPLAATGGDDAEPLDRVGRLAPAFSRGAVSRCAEGLSERRRRTSVGATGRDGVPLDGKLADRPLPTDPLNERNPVESGPNSSAF
jgi:hypothetical protein